MDKLINKSTQLFGDKDVALVWLNTPNDFLHDGNLVTPLKLAESESGYKIIESALNRTMQGMY